MNDEFFEQVERINASLPPAYLLRLLECDIVDDEDDWPSETVNYFSDRDA